MTLKAEHRYKKNQRIGRVGAQVRQSIVDAISDLLWSKHPWQLRASEISANCNLTQSSFYTYFGSMDEAIRACVLNAYASHPDMFSFVSGGWGPDDFPRARALTEAVGEYWRTHRPILALARSLGEEGHEDYLAIRLAPHAEFFEAAAQMVEHAQAAGRLSPHLQPRLVAYTAFGMLETFGATLHLHPAGGFSAEQSHDTMASHIFAALTGYVAER